MKIYKEVTIPNRVENQQIGIQCDICGKVSPKPDNWDGVDFHKCEVTIELIEGENYPDNGYGSTTRADICPDCFKGKLVPWLKNQGVEVTEEEWDW